MSDATEEAEGGWVENVAEKAALYDGTKGLFGSSWEKLAEMNPTGVVVVALQETAADRHAGFRGRMISIPEAAEVISKARARVGGVDRSSLASMTTTRRVIDLTAEPAIQLQTTLRRLKAAEEALLHPTHPPLTSERLKATAEEYCRARFEHKKAHKAIDKALGLEGPS